MKYSINNYKIFPYKIEGNDESIASAYKQKILAKFYRRKIISRVLKLSRKDCDIKYGTGEFFHLNAHSKFSILNGVDDPIDLFNHTKKHKMSGLAVTETGFMSSVPDNYLAAQNTELKYIAGICAYFNDYEILRRKLINDDKKPSNYPALIRSCMPYMTPNITILAKNAEGYKELLNLNSESWRDGYYYIPKVNRQMLKKYANGNLIILSGSLIDQFIQFGYVTDIENPEYGALSAYGYLEWFNKTFNEDFFVEIVMRCQDSIYGSDLDRLMTTAALLNQFKQKNNKKLNTVVTNDIKYINRDHARLYQAMIAINRNTTLKRIIDWSSEQYFKTRSELRGTFHTCLYNRAIQESEFEQACDNSLIIADKCETFKSDTSPKLPEINNANEILKKKTIKSLIDKGLHKNKDKFEVDGNIVTYIDQAKIELNRFIEKGFASYFLIMQDLIKHSHDLGWDTGPARGCTIPESLINTVNGTKQIKDVTTNDLVYDATGEIQKVQCQLSYNIDENLYEIAFNNNKILITSEHKLYIVRNEKVLLLKAYEIKNSDRIIISEELIKNK